MRRLGLGVCVTLLLLGLAQAMLAPAIVPEHSASLPQGRIAYATFGHGPALIAIHGSPGSKEDFAKLAALGDRYTVYALDMYGFGESEKNVDDYGIGAQADAVRGFLDERNISAATVMGYSWGGGVATVFAARYPERTDRLILLDAMGVQEGEPLRNYYAEHAHYALAYPFVAWYPGMILPPSRTGFLRSFIDSDQRGIRDLMASLHVPTTIIHGRDDTVVMPAIAQLHHELIANSTLVWIAGGHHQLKVDAREIPGAIP